MRIKNYIPNTITCLNLVSGCVASVMALEGNLMYAVVWIMLAAVFDLFDGLASRFLKAFSPIGKEFVSLADVVRFWGRSRYDPVCLVKLVGADPSVGWAQ